MKHGFCRSWEGEGGDLEMFLLMLEAGSISENE